ncbi:hypothetical protein F4824DRAFT_483275 [Ustulina deusta]|nr:hypothetical protein F4823DRAFT_615402 [Ustulina deusta]KAI3328470.1 hypothetical protein F4824DRAFT_483275 [Ustulina deusta]
MTFDALDLTHTCYGFINNPLGYKGMQHSSEEVDEINSEQTDLLSLFADLMSKFEQVAFENHGGRPLIASCPEDFWIHRWLPRITKTLNNLNGIKLTPKEKSAAESIGVVWGPQPVPTAACRNPGIPRYSPEYVVRELENIMNE